jgi:hypothetical protein
MKVQDLGLNRRIQRDLGCDYVDYCLVRCDIVQSGGTLPELRRILQLLSSGPNPKPPEL